MYAFNMFLNMNNYCMPTIMPAFGFSCMPHQHCHCNSFANQLMQYSLFNSIISNMFQPISQPAYIAQQSYTNPFTSYQNTQMYAYPTYQATSFDSNNYFNFTNNFLTPATTTTRSNITTNYTPVSISSLTTSRTIDLTRLGYNREKGERLGKIAIKNTIGFTGYCAKSVKTDIEEAGLGRYEPGHAYQCIDILRRNPNFKEISTNGLDLKRLPAGCVLVYEKGVAGYSSENGHIEITDGFGSARSDGKTDNIRNGAKVFIPV